MRKRQGRSTTTSIKKEGTCTKGTGLSTDFAEIYPQFSRMRVTHFEQEVYQAVSKIPPGKTRSYKWVAQKIGHPRAYRAVGNALNRNPYPIKIPCHRIIKSDGSIGGFSKGKKLKACLLRKESVGLKKE